MLDLLVVIWLMLRWLKILLAALKAWYRQPPRYVRKRNPENQRKKLTKLYAIEAQRSKYVPVYKTIAGSSPNHEEDNKAHDKEKGDLVQDDNYGQDFKPFLEGSELVKRKVRKLTKGDHEHEALKEKVFDQVAQIRLSDVKRKTIEKSLDFKDLVEGPTLAGRKDQQWGPENHNLENIYQIQSDCQDQSTDKETMGESYMFETAEGPIVKYTYDDVNGKQTCELTRHQRNRENLNDTESSDRKAVNTNLKHNFVEAENNRHDGSVTLNPKSCEPKVDQREIKDPVSQNIEVPNEQYVYKNELFVETIDVRKEYEADKEATVDFDSVNTETFDHAEPVSGFITLKEETDNGKVTLGSVPSGVKKLSTGNVLDNAATNNVMFETEQSSKSLDLKGVKLEVPTDDFYNESVELKTSSPKLRKSDVPSVAASNDVKFETEQNSKSLNLKDVKHEVSKDDFLNETVELKTLSPKLRKSDVPSVSELLFDMTPSNTNCSVVQSESNYYSTSKENQVGDLIFKLGSSEMKTTVADSKALSQDERETATVDEDIDESFQYLRGAKAHSEYRLYQTNDCFTATVQSAKRNFETELDEMFAIHQTNTSDIDKPYSETSPYDSVAPDLKAVTATVESVRRNFDAELDELFTRHHTNTDDLDKLYSETSSYDSVAPDLEAVTGTMRQQLAATSVLSGIPYSNSFGLVTSSPTRYSGKIHVSQPSLSQEIKCLTCTSSLELFNDDYVNHTKDTLYRDLDIAESKWISEKTGSSENLSVDIKDGKSGAIKQDLQVTDNVVDEQSTASRTSINFPDMSYFEQFKALPNKKVLTCPGVKEDKETNHIQEDINRILNGFDDIKEHKLEVII